MSYILKSSYVDCHGRGQEVDRAAKARRRSAKLTVSGKEVGTGDRRRKVYFLARGPASTKFSKRLLYLIM